IPAEERASEPAIDVVTGHVIEPRQERVDIADGTGRLVEGRQRIAVLYRRPVRGVRALLGTRVGPVPPRDTRADEDLVILDIRPQRPEGGKVGRALLSVLIDGAAKVREAAARSRLVIVLDVEVEVERDLLRVAQARRR